jgi:predicted amidohydrolase YtcJ
MAHALPGQWAMIWVPSTTTGLGIGADYLLGSTSDRVGAQKRGLPGGMSRGKLDALAPEMPVLVIASGGSWLLNTAARDDFLKMYEIEPTDENENVALTSKSLFGRALLAEKYFRQHRDELADVVEEELRHQPAGGFTTYSSHIQGLSFMPAFQQLVREERMPIRFAFAHRYCQEIEADQSGCFLRLGDWAGMGGKYFWNVGVTLGAIDGSSARACVTMEPLPEYRKPGSNWLLQDCRLRPDSPYWKAIHTALRGRYRYVVNHAFGDKSMGYFMDIMEQVIETTPDISLDFMRSLRLTADHCTYYPNPAQLPRMKKLGMMFSCTSGDINNAAPMMKVYGADKGERVAPIKSMLDAGIMVSSESGGGDLADDNPTTPMVHLYRFITRINTRGEIIGPNQAIDRVSALKMHTVWASYYVIREKELGTLEPGKLADYVVFNKDFFTIPEQEIPTVFPLMTVLGGKTMMLREELARELGMAAVGPQKKFRFVEEPREYIDVDEERE